MEFVVHLLIFAKNQMARQVPDHTFFVREMGKMQVNTARINRPTSNHLGPFVNHLTVLLMLLLGHNSKNTIAKEDRLPSPP